METLIHKTDNDILNITIKLAKQKDITLRQIITNQKLICNWISNRKCKRKFSDSYLPTSYQEPEICQLCRELRIPCGDSAAIFTVSLYFVWPNNTWKCSLHVMANILENVLGNTKVLIQIWARHKDFF